MIATRVADAAGLRGQDASDGYYTALLRSLGCTSFSFETAALLDGDDIAFHGVWDLSPRLGHGQAHRRRAAARGRLTSFGGPVLAAPSD